MACSRPNFFSQYDYFGEKYEMCVLFLLKQLQLYSGTTLFAWQCKMCEEVVLYSIFTLFVNYNSTFESHLRVSLYQNELMCKDVRNKYLDLFLEVICNNVMLLCRQALQHPKGHRYSCATVSMLIPSEERTQFSTERTRKK